VSLDSALSQYVLSYGGAAGLTLLLVLIGFLVPKRYHDREVAQEQEKTKQEEEKNRLLMSANERLQAALDIERDTNKQLQSSGQLVNHLVNTLTVIANEHRSGARAGREET
jgi:hypothetical protein